MVSRTGRCFCQANEFVFESDDNQVVNCHCQQCLGMFGHCSALLMVPEVRMLIVKDMALKSFVASANLSWLFCMQCGTTMLKRCPQEQCYYVPVGLLNDTSGLLLTENRHCQTESAYYPLSQICSAAEPLSCED